MIKLDKSYSDYTDETDTAAYPAGKAVDATTEESIDGTPYLKKWMNNIHGAFTALWVKAFGSVEGMSGQPDSAAHSDVLLAVEKLIELPLAAHRDTRGIDAHGATIAATPGQIVTRDALGRAKVAAPAAVDDIARKEEVDAEATVRANADVALQHAINILVPAGMIIASPLANVSQYLPCHGGEVSRADFPKLNAAMASLGYPYGEGNGHSTFHLPPFNVHGAFLRGKGGNAAGGLERQGDAIRNITGHVDFSIGIGMHSLSGVFQNLGYLDSRFPVIGGIQGLLSAFDFDVARSGLPTAPENRPVNHAIYWHIKY